jgi:hypothetical protein
MCYHKPIFVLVMTMALGLYFSACFESGGNSSPGGTGPEPVTIEDANQALEDVLFQLMSGSGPGSPGEIDFSTPYDLYSEVLSQQPTNATANFGAGLCVVMMIFQDPEINAAWNEWAAYLDTASFFEPPGTAGSGGYQPLLPGFPSPENLAAYPSTLVPATMGGMLAMALNNTPMFSDIQAVIETELLPRLEEAYSRLETVSNTSPGFTFTITPEMQGDPQEDVLELDLTEVYAMQAALMAADAFSRLIIAYNVDFVSYDESGLQQAFQQGGTNSILTLNSTGSTHLSLAQSSLESTLSIMETGIAFLENETDDQNDDIIKVADIGDLVEIKAGIDDAQAALTAPYPIMNDWDGDPLTPEVEVDFDVSQFFSNPIQDFKDLLPAYTVSVIIDTLDYQYDYHYDSDLVTAGVVADSLGGYYYWSRWYVWDQWGYYDEDFSSNISIPEFDAAFDAALAAFSGDPDVAYFYLSLYWGDSLSPGYNAISATLEKNWETMSAESGYVVVLTWEAASYYQWILPNPTFNGILPGMTDGYFKQTFGLTEEDWAPQLEIYFLD